MKFRKIKVVSTLSNDDSYILQQETSGLSDELKTALTNYFTHAKPTFDDGNGDAYIAALLAELAK